MRCVFGTAVLFSAALFLSACANAPKKLAGDDGPALAFAEEQQAGPADISPQVAMLRPDQLPLVSGGLAGRTIRVSRISDIALRPGEVVLTFDDGPIPGRTDRVLEVLDRFGVKATFLMVGQMAKAYPGTARKVAARGHTIGTHTQGHANLAGLGHAAAVIEIDKGRASVAAALGGHRAAPFFRFPYLASTAALRSHLAARGIVVIDANIDSKDYFKSSPAAIRARTMARLAGQRSGIILLHDIHARTATMLPGLLADLKAGGYKVVHLVPGSRDLLVAAVE
ncbi:polysaccharide deacetylase family protein [Nitratireductor mangrovi]|uniref:Chitooligosaccharide deacetylase n=1 Tax=Nitratireductor mangrovi TaxID=2599600 RepID=A0A5B8KVR4_9HYPH|nr:polysaccharide deacetylase family protein [Nitratireductor mangrovi]QDY99783.1 polysaccharide deacetylase family protein [Nitratireductor mangrovi]